jgi:RES domain-containing protein
LALDVDPTPVKGQWVKHVAPGLDPLSQRVPPPDNRWQRGTVVGAIYLAHEADTAWAEWYRHLAELGLPPTRQMPRELWTWDVDLTVADLSTESRLGRVGLALPRPRSGEWPPFQRVGEALAAEGWNGLLSVSAARPAHEVICLFRARDGSVPGAAPVGKPVLVHEPPAPPTGMTT